MPRPRREMRRVSRPSLSVARRASAAVVLAGAVAVAVTSMGPSAAAAGTHATRQVGSVVTVRDVPATGARHVDGAASRLTLGTWNVGPGSPKDLRGLLGQVDALALQEAGDRGSMLDLARKLGYRVLDGTGKPGQDSTPLVYDPHKLRLAYAFTAPIAARQYAGPGAGPSTLKAKWLVGGVFAQRATGRVVTIVSTHYVASSYTRVRHKIALAQTHAALVALRNAPGVPFLLGDFNTTPDTAIVRPFVKAGWDSDQRAGRELGTHGHRAIDQVWWHEDPVVDYWRHRTVATRSDHDALIAQFHLR